VLHLKRYLFDRQVPVQVLFRNYTLADFPQLIDIQRECFPPPFPSELWWNEEQIRCHVELFPEGTVCAEIAGQLVGSMTSLIVDYHPWDPEQDWATTTANGYIRGAHNPRGNTLYVVDIAVRPSFRHLGIGLQMMHCLYYLVVELGLERLLGGGRMPGYHRHADRLTPEEYVEEVVSGRLQDPVLTFLLKCGRMPVAIVPNYLEDAESLNYGVLMEWRNPFK